MWRICVSIILGGVRFGEEMDDRELGGWGLEAEERKGTARKKEFRTRVDFEHMDSCIQRAQLHLLYFSNFH